MTFREVHKHVVERRLRERIIVDVFVTALEDVEQLAEVHERRRYLYGEPMLLAVVVLDDGRRERRGDQLLNVRGALGAYLRARA